MFANPGPASRPAGTALATDIPGTLGSQGSADQRIQRFVDLTYETAVHGDACGCQRFGRPAIDSATHNRINTEFVQVLDRNNLRMRVWERGCGETMACGTGATASAVAAILNGHTFDTVSVHLKYGDLIIEWRDHDELYMTGGATTVFSGEYSI